jgi:hypothetical protein
MPRENQRPDRSVDRRFEFPHTVGGNMHLEVRLAALNAQVASDGRQDGQGTLRLHAVDVIIDGVAADNRPLRAEQAAQQAINPRGRSVSR